MLKVVSLGCEFPGTEEPRVRILNDFLIKTASSGIQDYWNGLTQNDELAYLYVLAMHSGEFYGSNGNSDRFAEKDLKQYHPRFIENAHVFLHHVNKDPKNSVGRPIYSHFNPGMHRVELILNVKKTSPLAMLTLEKLRNNEQLYVSMGVRVHHDQCSICGQTATSRKEYCDCRRHNLGKILADGRKVESLNPGPLDFFDISLVSKPADKCAFAIDKIASSSRLYSFGQVVEPTKSSAELGEEYETEQEKLAALRKLNEIIKHVDGDVTDLKDDKGELNVLKQVKDLNIRNLDYPQLSCQEMDGLGVRPGTMFMAFMSAGMPPSLGELAHIAGRHFMEGAFKESMIPGMLAGLPQVLKSLLGAPGAMDVPIAEILADSKDALEHPEVLEKAAEVVRTRLVRRIGLVKQACGAVALEKAAAEVLRKLPAYRDTQAVVPEENQPWGTFAQAARLKAYRMLSQKGPGYFEQFGVEGPDGSNLRTSRVSAAIASEVENSAALVKGIAGATMGLAALGAVIAEPNLLAKLAVVPAFGLLAYKLLSSSQGQRVTTSKQLEVPATSLFYGVKQGLEKNASPLVNAKTLAPLFGMTFPTALGLDYLYNKHIRHRGNPYFQEEKQGLGRVLSRVGQAVVDNPVTGLASGAMAGGFGEAALKMTPAMLRRLRRA